MTKRSALPWRPGARSSWRSSKVTKQVSWYRLLGRQLGASAGRYEGHAELMPRPLDPRKCNIGHDANALDRNGTVRDGLVERFQALYSVGKLILVVAGGVRDETLHPHTPGHVKDAADASHLSEAAETGCAYFITEDRRILGKRRELAVILPPSLSIVTLDVDCRETITPRSALVPARRTRSA